MMAEPSAQPPTRLDIALDLASQGIPVFPLIPDGKTPAVKDWPNRATTDPAGVRAMWAGRENELNIGVRTGRMPDGRFLLALDVDVKAGARGRESLAELDMLHGVGPWLEGVKRVRTGSGGEHYYFISDQPLGSTASRIGRGLDTRGEGGYVVAAGSVVDGRPYVDQGGALKPVPPWLATLIGTPTVRPRADNVVWLLDRQSSVDRAAAYLRDEAKLSVEGAGGDANAYAVACRVKDLGVSELVCLDLMSEHWDPRCSPPWGWEELAVKVAHAYRYGRDPPGVKDPHNIFDDVLDEPKAEAAGAPLKKPRLFFRLARDIRPALDRTALIDGWLDLGAMAVLYGDSNVGKTFVALAKGWCVSTGTPVAGRRVERGGIVYVAAEAGMSIERRVEALKRLHRVDDVPLAVVPCAVDLLRPDGDVEALVALIAEAAAAMGIPVVFIVIDTLSRALQGGNENSSEDMGAFVINVDKIRAATRAAVMIVHHSGKNKAMGARGHSLLRAATDTEIEIEAGVIRVTKQRDMEVPKAVPFRLESVPIGTRSDGTIVTSAVAMLNERDSTAGFKQIELTELQREAMECLAQAIEEEGVSIKERWSAHEIKWRETWQKRNKSLEGAVLRKGRSEEAFRYHRRELRRKGAINEIVRKHWVICNLEDDPPKLEDASSKSGGLEGAL